MAKRNLELKTSPRPKDRPAGLGMSLEDDAFNQRARAASEESANVEFRASLQPQMSYNPLARLGYDPNKAKVVDAPSRNAFYFPNTMEQEGVDNFFLDSPRPPKKYKEGDIKPDDVTVFSSSESPLTSAFPSFWSHEFTHRGVEQVIEYMREDPKYFKEKYGKAASERLVRIALELNNKSSEAFTELFDDFSAVEKIGGELVDHKAKLDSGNSAGSIEEFQKEIAKKKPEDRWDHNTSKYADVVGIMTAAQDLLTAKGEPPVAEQKQKGFFGKIKEALGFAEGGSVMRTDNQMKLYALGGMEDDGMEVDPVSGNEIPPGSMAREVRDDIPAQLSDGEYVVPADVVRFFGVKYFEDLRQEAKMGLQGMEQDGRIGGEPVEMAQGLTEGDMAALQEMTRTGVASGGLMDKIAYTAMNDPVVNERLNSYGVPVKFAVGGMAQSQYNNPTEVDQIIQQVSATLQQRPEIMQELAKRGITISRTEADVPAQQMATANSPSQTTEPIMAATGTLVNSPYINPISAATTSTPNTNTNQYSLLPPGFDTFNTLGGSYFTPESYNAPNVPQPVAAPAPAQPVAPPTCPPGYMWDAASNSCVSAGGNNDDGPDYDIEPEEAGPPKVNYFDKDFDLSSVGADGLGGVGKAVQAGSFLLGGGPGLAFSGVINTAKQSESIANTRMAAMIAQAKGDTKLADTLNARAKEMLGQASGMTKGIAELGGLRGVNYLAKQLEHYAPAGFDVSKITGLNERQMKRLEDAYAKNPASTAKAVTAAGAGSATRTFDASKIKPVSESNKAESAKASKSAKTVYDTGMKDSASVISKSEKTGYDQAIKQGKTTTEAQKAGAANKAATKTAAEKVSSSLANRDRGGTTGFAKGGLMARSK